MCPPSKDASFLQKLRTDYNNTYYRLFTVYVMVMLALIFASIVFRWRIK